MAEATFPGANGRIAFDFEAQPYGTDIFTVLPDGSDVQQLTSTPGYEIDPSWSPDGRRIAFTASGAGRSWIYTMNADGSDQVAVVDAGDQYAWPYTSPSFSPNGQRLVYTTLDAIRTVRADGTDREVILRASTGRSESRCCLYDPAYSPTGKRIAFARGPRGTPGAGIGTMRPNGTRLRQLTAPERAFDEAPEYSPDGRMIVFRRRSGAAFAMRSDGSNETLLPGQAAYSFGPSYSPVGDQIVGVRVMASSKVDVCSDLFTVPVSGSTTQIITGNCIGSSGPSAGSPSWQPIPG